MIHWQIPGWALPALVFGVVSLVALLIRHILLRILDRHVHEVGSFPRVLLEAIRIPSVLWCLAGGLAAALHNANAPPALERWMQKGITAFVIISVTMVCAAVAVRMVTSYGERRKLHFVVAGLSRTLLNATIFAIGLLVLLSEFDVRITPILTALGVGGLAVALALQDTLANVFAGIHLLVEEPIVVGDYIELTEGQKGTVRDIGWRTTRILSGSNTMIIVPNSKITSGVLTNYNLPDRRVNAEISIVAAHSADARYIADLALKIAANTPGVLTDPSPVVQFDPGVLPTHLQLKLIVFVSSIPERVQVQSDVRAALNEAFRREGIPYPPIR